MISLIAALLVLLAGGAAWRLRESRGDPLGLVLLVLLVLVFVGGPTGIGAFYRY